MPQQDISLTRLDQGPNEISQASGAGTGLSSAMSDWFIGHSRHWAYEIKYCPSVGLHISNTASWSSMKLQRFSKGVVHMLRPNNSRGKYAETRLNCFDYEEK